MSISRRSFVRSIGLGSAGALAWPIVAARGSEALAGGLPAPLDLVPDTIRLDSNENPRGPSSEAMDAIRATLGEGGRYPRDPTAQLHAALATSFGVHGGNIVLGCGSTEILRSAVFAFTSPTRHVVIAAPTFETPGSTAEMLGLPVRSIPVDRALRLDLDAMLDAAPGAGLVYLCNPNNPTGTVHGAAAVRDFVARVRQVSPRTVILID